MRQIPYFLVGFFFGATFTDGCGLGCFSTSLGSSHFRGWRLKRGQLGTVTSVVKTTPPAYVSIIVWKEAMKYPPANATTANASNKICISCSASFCPCQSIFVKREEKHGGGGGGGVD
uniref:Uncharacterized protein n=1 Tax=Lotus japonicus TaxID=34305 RepID=I3T4X6_LOTJA|nr:unknown [Lotus japonicus]